MVKNICSALRKAFKVVIAYWNKNATKRWLLALDRLSIAFIFLAMLSYANLAYDLSEAHLILYACVCMLFFLLYTPSYMFPGSNEELKPSDKKTKE